jgi:hypothetical protein
VRVHAALRLTHHHHYGRALVATAPIRPAELVLSETPALVATAPRALEPPLRRLYQAGADSLAVALTDLLILHAFARAPRRLRDAISSECCGVEALPSGDHSILDGARRAADWAAANDPACAALPLSELVHALVVFDLNAFGMLNDGRTGGRSSLFLLGSKFTHRCLRPNVVFHGVDGALVFHAVEPEDSIVVVFGLVRGSRAEDATHHHQQRRARESAPHYIDLGARARAGGPFFFS